MSACDNTMSVGIYLLKLSFVPSVFVDKIGRGTSPKVRICVLITLVKCF